MADRNAVLDPLWARCLGVLAFGMFLMLPVTAASADNWVVDGNDKTITHNCHGGTAVINGNRDNLTLQECPTVQVNGNNNIIDAGVPTSLNVLGNRNEIAWARKSKDDKAPNISNAGTGNKILEKK